MSSEEKPKLLAGHPPAVKVGGMRTQRTHKTSNSKEEPMTKEEEEEFGVDVTTKVSRDVVLGTTVIKEKDAYPPEAIKAYHDTPLASKDKHAVPHKNQIHHIHQPSKQ